LERLVTTHIISPVESQIAPLRDAYREAIAQKRLKLATGIVILIVATLAASWGAEVDLATLWNKIGNFTSYFNRLFFLDNGQRVWTDLPEWFWGLKKWGKQLAETVLMAYVATLTGAIAAFFLCFSAARNIAPSSKLMFIVRRGLEFCRTVPEIVFALIFVVAFGLGAMAGVLAIAIHTMGALGKLFSEVVENIDLKPVEGTRASGGTWAQQVRFGAVPQVLSNFVSYALLRFEINVRGAAVMGFVGAGGIGQDLIEAIRKFYYSDVSAILLLIILAVMIIDTLTEKLRHHLLGNVSS
jgi:phosphonate transport system permease protein